MNSHLLLLCRGFVGATLTLGALPLGGCASATDDAALAESAMTASDASSPAVQPWLSDARYQAARAVVAEVNDAANELLNDHATCHGQSLSIDKDPAGKTRRVTLSTSGATLLFYYDREGSVRSLWSEQGSPDRPSRIWDYSFEPDATEAFLSLVGSPGADGDFVWTYADGEEGGLDYTQEYPDAARPEAWLARLKACGSR